MGLLGGWLPHLLRAGAALSRTYPVNEMQSHLQGALEEVQVVGDIDTLVVSQHHDKVIGTI